MFYAGASVKESKKAGDGKRPEGARWDIWCALSITRLLTVTKDTSQGKEGSYVS